MLGLADIEAWSDEIREEIVDELRRDGWQAAAPKVAPSRMRPLLDRFRAGRPLTLGELNELRNGLAHP